VATSYYPFIDPADSPVIWEFASDETGYVSDATFYSTNIVLSGNNSIPVNGDTITIDGITFTASSNPVNNNEWDLFPFGNSVGLAQRINDNPALNWKYTATGGQAFGTDFGLLLVAKIAGSAGNAVITSESSVSTNTRWGITQNETLGQDTSRAMELQNNNYKVLIEIWSTAEKFSDASVLAGDGTLTKLIGKIEKPYLGENKFIFDVAPYLRQIADDNSIDLPAYQLRVYEKIDNQFGFPETNFIFETRMRGIQTAALPVNNRSMLNYITQVYAVGDSLAGATLNYKRALTDRPINTYFYQRALPPVFILSTDYRVNELDFFSSKTGDVVTFQNVSSTNNVLGAPELKYETNSGRIWVIDKLPFRRSIDVSDRDGYTSDITFTCQSVLNFGTLLERSAALRSEFSGSVSTGKLDSLLDNIYETRPIRDYLRTAELYTWEKIELECDQVATPIFWKNRFGLWDYFEFIGVTEETVDRDSVDFEKNNYVTYNKQLWQQKSEVTSNLQTEYTITSGWVDLEHMQYLKNLLASNEQYISLDYINLNAFDFYQWDQTEFPTFIKIIDFEWEVNSEEDLFNLTLTYRLSIDHNNIRQ
jgi:hypothetical protein